MKIRVEALKTDKGFFIPINEELSNIRQERVILEIRIIQDNESCRISESESFYGIFKTSDKNRVKEIVEDKDIYYE